MKILFSSYAYASSVGGIETVSRLLAREFAAVGHEIVLVTETPSASRREESFEVVRNPGLAQLLKILRWCDVVFQNNVSLRHLIPALLLRKPALVVHQTWIRNMRGGISWNDRIKRALLPRLKNVAISQAVAADANIAAKIIGNPYDDQIFKTFPNITRDREMIFVGRLVSDKGADVLLRALGILRQRDIAPNLTIVGHGPEEENLRALVRELALEQAVTFTGAKVGAELAELMNRHQLIVIPSRWPEPFGIVALEGIACGCIAIGSEQGGLSEAIGNCGMTFRNGETQQLAERLRQLLIDPLLREKLRLAAPAHLERFRAHTVAHRYLALLHQLTA